MLPDLHCPYQSVLDQVNVLDHLVRQNVPVRVADDLMDVDHSSPDRIGLEAQRLDVGIDHSPLARPVVDIMMGVEDAKLESFLDERRRQIAELLLNGLLVR